MSPCWLSTRFTSAIFSRSSTTMPTNPILFSASIFWPPSRPGAGPAPRASPAAGPRVLFGQLFHPPETQKARHRKPGCEAAQKYLIFPASLLISRFGTPPRSIGPPADFPRPSAFASGSGLPTVQAYHIMLFFFVQPDPARFPAALFTPRSLPPVLFPPVPLPQGFPPPARSSFRS